MSKRNTLELEPCPVCGRDAQWKDVKQPFYHGWVGCRECQRFIKWSGKGKRTAIDLWNAEAKTQWFTGESIGAGCASRG